MEVACATSNLRVSQDATKVERPFILNVVSGLEWWMGTLLLIVVHMASATALRVMLCYLLRMNVSLSLKKCVQVTESRGVFCVGNARRVSAWCLVTVAALSVESMAFFL